MSANRLNFTIFELVKSNSHPSIENLIGLLGKENFYSDSEDTVYEIDKSPEKNFLWVCFEYGKPNPRSNFVINKAKNNEKEPNPRSNDQIETNSQLFCLYDEFSGNLYMSNSRKRNFLTEYLNDKLENDQDNILIKRVIIDPDEFLNQLRTVEAITVGAKTDLLTMKGSLFEPVQHILGYDSPEKYELSAVFKAPLDTKLRKLFNMFRKEREDGLISKFVCIGKDDSGLETIYNADNFTRKVSIRLGEEENGLYSKNLVKTELLNHLKRAIGEN